MSKINTLFILAPFFISWMVFSADQCSQNEDLKPIEVNNNSPNRNSTDDIQNRSTHSPITTELTMARAPKLNEVVELVCITRSSFDASGTLINIELPAGAVLVEGVLAWKGDLKQNIPVKLSAKVKFTREGDLTIKAKAKKVIDEKNWWGDTDYIYLNVTKKSGKFGFSKKNKREHGQTTKVKQK